MVSMELNKILFAIYSFVSFSEIAKADECPFNNECECYDDTFNLAVCPKLTIFPVFTGSPGSYSVDTLIVKIGNVSTIPANAFLVFRSIDWLILENMAIGQSASWDEAVFDNVSIRAVEFFNISDAVPPRATLEALGKNGLEELSIIQGQEKSLDLWTDIFEIFPKLQILTIENTSISSIETKAFPSTAAPTNIRELYLNKDEISSIPTNLLHKCKHLSSLSLRYNRISAVVSEDFPAILEELKMLDLSGNPITTISLLNGPWKLETLYLRKTNLKSIDLTVFRGTNLAVLDMSDSKHLELLSASAENKLPNFKDIVLRETGLKVIDPSIESLFDRLDSVGMNFKRNMRLHCGRDVGWMSKYFIRKEQRPVDTRYGYNHTANERIFIDDSYCTNMGKYLEEYLLEDSHIEDLF